MIKPIYTGTYDAFSSFDREALRRLIQKIDKPFKRIAEIGSWIGNGSTQTIIEEIKGGDGILYCIDHWRGNANVPRHQELVAKFDMFETFKRNVALYGGTEVVKPLVMSSQEASSIIQNHIFDLVFIDGNHSYDETIQDVEWWHPKVINGGILCGHDCEGNVKDFDKDHLYAKRNNDSLEGNQFFTRIHPGVILAVSEKFGDTVHLWAEEIIVLEEGALGRSTVWDITVS